MPSLLPGKGADPSVKKALTSAQGQLQTTSHSSFDREPLVAEIPDGGFVLAKIAGTCYIYTRLGNQRYKVAFTTV